MMASDDGSFKMQQHEKVIDTLWLLKGDVVHEEKIRS